MVLYKLNCDSQIANEKATPSILAIEVWLVKVNVGWLLIEYYATRAQLLLAILWYWQVGSWLEESKKTHSKAILFQGGELS